MKTPPLQLLTIAAGFGAGMGAMAMGNVTTVSVAAGGGSVVMAQSAECRWPNKGMLRALERIQKRGAGRKLTHDPTSADKLREAREGGMYDIDPS